MFGKVTNSSRKSVGDSFSDAIGRVLLSLFGSKFERDKKELDVYKDATLAFGPAMEALDNDALRAKTIEFKERIHSAIKEEEDALELIDKRLAEE